MVVMGMVILSIAIHMLISYHSNFTEALRDDVVKQQCQHSLLLPYIAIVIHDVAVTCIDI